MLYMCFRWGFPYNVLCVSEPRCGSYQRIVEDSQVCWASSAHTAGAQASRRFECFARVSQTKFTLIEYSIAQTYKHTFISFYVYVFVREKPSPIMKVTAGVVSGGKRHVTNDAFELDIQTMCLMIETHD